MVAKLGEPRAAGALPGSILALTRTPGRGGAAAFADLLQEAQILRSGPEAELADATSRRDSGMPVEDGEHSADAEARAEEGEAAPPEEEEGTDGGEDAPDAADVQPLHGLGHETGSAQAAAADAVAADADDAQVTTEGAPAEARPVDWSRAIEDATGARAGKGAALEEETLAADELPDGAPAEVAGARDESSAFDLLSASELLDPDLVVESAPGQLLDRLREAIGTGTAASPQLDQMGDVVLPQVVRGLAALVRNGAAEMRLQLEPADLGEIELRVRTSEGTVRGELLVQHAEVKHLLDSQVGRLRQALADQGLSLEEFDVGVDVGRHAHFGHGEAGERNSRGEAGISRRAEPIAPPEAATTRTAARAGDGRVDYTV